MRITSLALLIILTGAAGPDNPLLGSWAPADAHGGACATRYTFTAATQTDVTVAGADPINHPVRYTISPGMVYATGSGGSTRWDINGDGTVTLRWPPFCKYHRVG